MIVAYLDGKTETCVLDLWKNALHNDASKPSKKESQEIGVIMQGLDGWVKQDKVKRFTDFGVQKWWARVDDFTADVDDNLILPM